MDKLKTPYNVMCLQLSKMSKEEIQRHLELLGCTWSYDKIKEELQLVYNELRISDRIFQECKIQNDNSPYTIDFIDEVVLEVTKREKFPFVHYGRISTVIDEAIQVQKGLALVFTLLEQFEKLIDTAKYFKQTSLEVMMYEVNDRIDLLGALALLLDELLQAGRYDAQYYHRIIHFVDAYLAVFTKTSEEVETMLYYEQATAYVAIHSPKGEQLFKRLLETYRDQTDVVLHYGLAYLDDDETRTLRIFKRYKHLLNKESDAYDIIHSIILDLKGDA